VGGGGGAPHREKKKKKKEKKRKKEQTDSRVRAGDRIVSGPFGHGRPPLSL